MPQLDRAIVFSQIFWLFFVFSSLYIILTHFFFPLFLKSLKTRKKIIEVNSLEVANLVSKSIEKQIILKQITLKHLLTVENMVIDSFLDSTNIDSFNQELIFEKIGLMSYNSILYCDNELLDLIVFDSKLFKSK